MPKAQLLMTQADEDATTLFVGNIADQVTEELLYELFIQVGPLASVKIPNDNKGNKCSFGFIQFKHSCSPDYAINLLQGTSLFHRTINLQRRNNKNKGNNIQRQQRPPQDDHNTRYNNYNERRDMQDLRTIRFDSDPNFDSLLEMSANLVPPGNSRDYRGHNDNRRYSDHNRNQNDSNRGYNNNQRGQSRGSDNRNRDYQGSYDNKRYDDYSLPKNDNDRSYDGRRGHSSGKSHHNKHSRSHDRRPYDPDNRKGRY